jgi:signal transduction histidine kinase
VSLSETIGEYTSYIADNGKGIPDSRKKHLFDATRRYDGVGLHLSKHIVERYGSRIEVVDRVPEDSSQGLEVRVWLPKAT